VNEWIWFFVVEVRARKAETQALVEGSTALLQCFLTATTIEDALHQLDDFLAAEAFDRLAIRKAQSFEHDFTRDEIGNDVVFAGLRQAAASGLPHKGTMVVAREAAAWKS